MQMQVPEARIHDSAGSDCTLEYNTRDTGIGSAEGSESTKRKCLHRVHSGTLVDVDSRGALADAHAPVEHAN